MKYFVVITFALLYALQGRAQLASEKPLSGIYSEAVKQKLNKPKVNSGHSSQLPSNAPLPKQVVQSQSNRPVTNRTVPGTDIDKTFPSNSKKLSLPIRPRKIDNSGTIL